VIRLRRQHSVPPANRDDRKLWQSLAPHTLETRLLLADRGYDSRAVRAGVCERGHEPGISERNKPHTGRKRDARARERQAIERTFSWLGAMRRLATRWERHDEIYLAFLSLGCAVICSRTLAKAFWKDLHCSAAQVIE
jgi:transposase